MSETRSKTPWILIVVLLVVFCGGGLALVGVALLFGRMTAPVTIATAPYVGGGTTGNELETVAFTPVLLDFKRALAKGDGAAAYLLLTDGYRRDVSEAEFLRLCEEIDPSTLLAPENLDAGEFTLLESETDASSEPVLRSGSWVCPEWMTGGRSERIDVEEVERDVWRISAWVVGE